MKYLSYRKDIDGFRCLAILAVLAFHAFPTCLPGGFVGVDVFFVISGFLISGIVYKELKKNQFSFLKFYARRCRRLLPALILMTIAVWTAAYYLLLPEEFLAFGKHLMGAGSFTTNLVLWKESGYFDSASETKPFLHLWSLGVEEQFYLVWPISLFLLSKIKKIKPWIGILVLLLVSLILNIDQIKYESSSVFYGMTTRLWQFMVGALLVFCSVPRREKLSKICTWFIEIFVLLGFAAVLIPCFKYTQDLQYPGWRAIPPTLGAGILIYLGTVSKITKIIFANPVAVYIGLISYPLYLWHWPLISFLHITEGGALASYQIWIAVTLAFVLAILTYEIVEKPIQRKLNFLSSSPLNLKVLKVSGGLLGCLFILGYMTWNNGGFPTRFENYRAIRFVDPYGKMIKDSRGYFCPDQLKSFNLEFCRMKKEETPLVAFWGDSLSVALEEGFEYLRIPSLLIEQGGCPPLSDIQVTLGGQEPFCKTQNQDILKRLIEMKDLKAVVLISLGRPYIEKIRRGQPWNIKMSYQGEETSDLAKAYEKGLRATAQALIKAGKQVVIYDPQPELSAEVKNPKDCKNARPFRFAKVQRSDCKRSEEEFIQSRLKYRSLLAEAKKMAPKMIIFNTSKYFCQNNICSAFDGDRALYLDPEHLTVDGGRLVSINLAKTLGLSSH